MFINRPKVVPENILKKQERDARLRNTLKVNREKAKKERKAAREVAFKNAEKYYKEYLAEDDALLKAKRDAKAAGNFYVEAEPKVAFLIRIKG